MLVILIGLRLPQYILQSGADADVVDLHRRTTASRECKLEAVEGELTVKNGSLPRRAPSSDKRFDTVILEAAIARNNGKIFHLRGRDDEAVGGVTMMPWQHIRVHQHLYGQIG